MAKRKQRKLSKKEAKAEGKRLTQVEENKAVKEAKVEKEKTGKRIVLISPVLTVREFADILNLSVTEIISKLVKNGVMATINELIDFDTMAIIADEFAVEVKLKEEEKIVASLKQVKKNLKLRSPVVTVMGHVDHGKTKLLDAIRHTDVIATEAGGITQHIGAYQVTIRPKDETSSQGSKSNREILRKTQDDFASKSRKITFLDTPGHEAFSAMRAHGANITDVVVLVVAANDGVKPQTIEAINHAKEAGVPIVVAINKVDLPDADIDKTKRQLADNGLLSEQWGGDVPMINVSAKETKNIDSLLEMILLVADLKELKADPTLSATGVVIESHMQSGMGPIATVLVQEGTLKIGDPIVIGDTYGKVRIMENYLGKKIKEAAPSVPVRIAGLQDLPDFGNRFLVVENEKTAKELTKTKTIKRRVISITELSQDIKAGKIKELKIVLKSDVAGSLEAIKSSLKNLEDKEVKIKIIHEGVGDISESDINMAVASHALVIGFRVKASTDVMNLARRENIKISIYDIIYQLLDDLTAALSGLLEPEIIETEIGRLSILAVFKTSKNEKIIGGRVTKGKLEDHCQVRIVRDKDTIGMGEITSLQQNKKDTSEVAEGFECGLKVESPTKILVGDSLECYKKEERTRKLGE
ncbi:MAG: Translation initiation factor IF-2 [Berkelbacteria bacterium GW2011_GWA1_39_10]|uniref:Translation initiation factor IF-2 n=1 Tax=Berkelbacteria bacterium GW2011_GWA1_39_10 TaxID=1618332 RepID=A0A0G0NYP8_9BACT|nr:MAG: Translation initiation factor IF-2 [Berkelbacteria bacterium GW2011_GWA1_39_10]